MNDLRWRRLVRHEDGAATRFVELAADRATLYIRTGDGVAVRLEDKPLRTTAHVARAIEERVAALHKQGYVDDGETVGRAVATPPPPPKRAPMAADAQFDAGLARFVAAWRELGYHIDWRFTLEGGRTKVHPNAIAARCLEVATTAFQMTFTRWMSEADEEHGRPGPIGDRHLAEFYQTPIRVAELAWLHLRRELPSATDGSWPGKDEVGPLMDEIRRRIHAIDEAP